MGCNTTVGGVGQVSLQHFPSIRIEWVGLQCFTSNTGGATITSGFNATAGAHLVFIDDEHKVGIQVASADTIRVHNGSTGTRAGNVTLVW